MAAPRQEPFFMCTTLITAAAERMGSQAALARTLEVEQSMLSNWKAGKMPCPAEYRAMMHMVLGQPYAEAAAAALLEASAHKPLGRKLARAAGVVIEQVLNP